MVEKSSYYKFPKTHPAAYTAFTKMSFSTTHIGQMAALVDVDGMSHQDAASAWLAANQDVVSAFK